jgi:DNA polymerase-3 subunit delta
MHATAFLKKPDQRPPGPMVALFGAERFLKLRALKALSTVILGAGEEELGLTKYPGATTDFSTVMDELRTLSMFGSRRVVVIEEADEFVTKHRSALEKYLDKPAKKGVLVLDVKSWTSSTRLAKKVVELGLDLDCSPLKQGEMLKWLGEHAQAAYGKQLTRDAAQALIELRGLELGHLDQELAKLAAYAGDKAQIDRASVEKLVGGWKAETTWSMLDAVRDGQIDEAFHLLEKLIMSGEHPLRLLGSIQWTYRPLARATEAARQGQPLGEALTEAGVRPMSLGPAQQYLKRIGRPRAERMFQWLLAADRDLKGASQLPERLVMERLLWQLSGK